MNAQSLRTGKACLAGIRSLLPVLFLSLASVCVAEETTSAPAPAAGNHGPGRYIGEPDDGRAKGKPAVEDLGQGKYRIGDIEVDKPRRLITVPGVMLPYEDGKAIEFLATTRHGYKSYESVLMLEANAFEFNLACILIGLDSKQSVSPEYHFDPKPVKGDPVSIRISWENRSGKHDYDAVELLKTGNAKPAATSVWSYTGSMFMEGDRYLAQMDGVLIGLVHDPASIIEHRDGLGLGRLGAVTVNPDKAPDSGQAVKLSIRALGSASSE